MPRNRIRLWALVAALLGLCLAQAKEARASTFEVSPIRVTLSQSSSTGLLTVHNTSSEPLRFQVTAYAWSQGSKGEVQLSATKDIVFFPAMLALQPGKRRNVRVGTVAPFGASEKTYRVFVEELPPASASVANTVRVLTKFGIPVFLEPAAPRSEPKLQSLTMLGRKLSFSLKNDGNTHFLTRHVWLSAKGPDGSELLRQELPAWYILAGGARDYTFQLPATACAASRLVVSVETDARSFESALAVPEAPCKP